MTLAMASASLFHVERPIEIVPRGNRIGLLADREGPDDLRIATKTHKIHKRLSCLCFLCLFVADCPYGYLARPLNPVERSSIFQTPPRPATYKVLFLGPLKA